MIYVNIFDHCQCLNTFRYILSFHPLQLPSFMNQNINPITLFCKKERARIAHISIKIKIQCVVVKLYWNIYSPAPVSSKFWQTKLQGQGSIYLRLWKNSLIPSNYSPEKQPFTKNEEVSRQNTKVGSGLANVTGV